jgi:hypothetical protein
MTNQKELEKDQIILQKDLHKLISPYVRPDEPESSLMTSGTLLATSIHLYIALYKDDEVIKTILENTKESLSQLRESTHQQFHATTLH